MAGDERSYQRQDNELTHHGYSYGCPTARPDWVDLECGVLWDGPRLINAARELIAGQRGGS